MSSYSPPIATGKLPTTPARFLIAATLILLLDTPLFFIIFVLIFPWWVLQLMALAAVLIFSPRFWIALLLMLVLSLGIIALFLDPSSVDDRISVSWFLIPTWLGFFAAYRPYPSPPAKDEDKA